MDTVNTSNAQFLRNECARLVERNRRLEQENEKLRFAVAKFRYSTTTAASLKDKKACAVCGAIFIAGKQKRFCSPKCKRTDRENRRAVTPEVILPQVKPEAVAREKASCPGEINDVDYSGLCPPDGGRAIDFMAGF